MCPAAHQMCKREGGSFGGIFGSTGTTRRRRTASSRGGIVEGPGSRDSGARGAAVGRVREVLRTGGRLGRHRLSERRSWRRESAVWRCYEPKQPLNPHQRTHPFAEAGCADGRRSPGSFREERGGEHYEHLMQEVAALRDRVPPVVGTEVQETALVTAETDKKRLRITDVGGASSKM